MVASLAALALDTALFSATLRIARLPWEYAGLIGFLGGALVAYVLSVRWVFPKRRLRSCPMLELVIFVGIGVLGLGVTWVALWIGMELMKFPAELMKLTAAGVTFLFNFGIRKGILFSASGK